MKIKSITNGSAMNAIYENRASEIINGLQGRAHKLSLECVHTCETYSALVMCDSKRTDGSYSSLESTVLSFEFYDNDKDITKQLTFTVYGDAERDILIDIFKASVEVLETGTLTIEQEQEQ